ncbi:hypothetical protein E2C01_076814 [Portunus trituberculatus]|uniref:Uncharacterized protein n=1 Tax=Portunus trituberculatus TaxID=210409 RepID=A0A5B7IKN1_PORTR|nr:hypothetical protein [Portunus trituberculatus]
MTRFATLATRTLRVATNTTCPLLSARPRHASTPTTSPHTTDCTERRGEGERLDGQRQHEVRASHHLQKAQEDKGGPHHAHHASSTTHAHPGTCGRERQ